MIIIEIIENRNIDGKDHVKFIRIEPGDLSHTLNEIINALADISWIAQFDKEYVKNSYYKRASDSARYLAEKIKLGDNNLITSDAGEYVVSELSRQAIVNEFEYLDIPLAELFKEQVAGNPGFDYYSATKSNVLVFGEAKFSSSRNAYGVGLRQVVKFINEKQDISDLTDIDKFFDEDILDSANKGIKAYSIAFTSKETTTEKIIEGIKRNSDYQKLLKYHEIILVAVNI